MAATLKEIAEKAEVSVALVCRLLNGDKKLKIRDKTRQSILNARDSLGGVREKKAARSKSCNIIIPINKKFFQDDNILSIGFLGKLFSAVEQFAAKKNMRFSIAEFNNDHKFDYFQDLCNAPDYCDGVLICTSVMDQKLADLLTERQFPHVSLDYNDENFGLNTVVAHSIGGYRQALTHLVALGHQRIGYLGHKFSLYPILVAAMIEKGIVIDENLYCPTVSVATDTMMPADYREAARKCFGEWLDRGPVATAMFCHNDFGAMGACDAMDERGLTPGHDISLVGYDNIEDTLNGFTETPNLTTIEHPAKPIYRRCAELLYQQVIDGSNQIVHEHIPVKLVMRKSTGIAIGSLNKSNIEIKQVKQGVLV